MGTSRTVVHYASGDNRDYEFEWSKAVLEYLEKGYPAEEKNCELEVGSTTYKVLKRDTVTAFYDADGNTLFDIENDRLKEEYEAMESLDETEPKSEIGRAIAGIEKQAFEQAVDNNIGTDEMIPMGTASLEEIAKGIPAPTPEEVETAKKNNSSVYIGVVGAVTKLQEELKQAKNKTFAEPVVKHLIERCKESESLASDICQNHKTWEKCYQYINEQARKQAKGNSCAVRDDVVYEWAEDYYHKDDKAEEEEKAKAAKKAKEEGKKCDEIAAKAKARAKAKTSAKPNKNRARADYDTTLKANTDNHKLSAKEIAEMKAEEEKKSKKAKKSGDIDGQMDIFSFMGM